jgi:hypothetical protein
MVFLLMWKLQASRGSLGTILVTLGLALLACSSASDDSDDGDSAYRTEILAAAKTASSAFEKDVLSDGDITRAEYVEAANRYMDCVREHGVDIDAVDEFGVNNYAASNMTGSNEKYLDTCTEGTIFIIEGIYSQMVKNPDNVDMKQLLVECFVNSGLADKGYTVDDYVADTSGPNGSKFPFDDTDPRFSDCMLNPQTHR